MPNHRAFGTQKVVRGLSRVSSFVNPVPVSVTVSAQPLAPTSDLASLSAALFGSTPPSDDDCDNLSPSSSGASISPPPAYTTIYPPSPPLSGNEKPSFILGPPEPARSLLTRVFPAQSPIHELPATRISLADLVDGFEGVVINDVARGTRTLFVGGGDFEDLDLREAVCGILERAEDELGCTGVVLAIEKKTDDLGDLLHSLMYVGGVITTGPCPANPAYLLVGLDL